MRKIVCLISLVLIALAISSCPDRSKDREIVIGFVGDLTGPIAQYGKWAKNGADIALEEINASATGGPKLRLIVEDAQSDPKVAVSAVTKLISVDNVQVIVIATASSAVMAAAPICENKKVVLFSPTASSGNISQAGDYVFRNRISGVQEASSMARYASTSLGLKKVGLVLINNDAGPPYENAFRSMFVSLGGEVLGLVWQNPGETDFRTQANQLREMKEIEAVFVASTAKETAYLVKQSAEIGFRPRWLSITTVESPDIFKIGGNSLVGLIYSAEAYDPSREPTSAFDAKYKKRFGESSQNYSANSYDAINILYSIMKSGFIKGPEIHEQLYKNQYMGVTGPVSFDANGDAKKRIMIKEVSAGSFKIREMAPEN